MQATTRTSTTLSSPNAAHSGSLAQPYRELIEKPSFYFHRQVFATFIDDVVGIRNRDIIGVNNILWSSDYPHVNSSWPTSREYIRKHFGDIPAEEARRMTCENTAELYGIQLP